MHRDVTKLAVLDFPDSEVVFVKVWRCAELAFEFIEPIQDRGQHYVLTRRGITSPYLLYPVEAFRSLPITLLLSPLYHRFRSSDLCVVYTSRQACNGCFPVQDDIAT